MAKNWVGELGGGGGQREFKEGEGKGGGRRRLSNKINSQRIAVHVRGKSGAGREGRAALNEREKGKGDDITTCAALSSVHCSRSRSPGVRPVAAM